MYTLSLIWPLVHVLLKFKNVLHDLFACIRVQLMVIHVIGFSLGDFLC